ncbi:hypothetical protein Y032_0096g2891 [Ancylostoma ceylanicum]|uniref:Uncharacterized protein n=1 Tax=Ancylostoma ceylanicum TaxID=53326 RepID=A0A016TK02_9BILA|nr:hypothetical protein Y032_0096g2891 [Ancylostoma ceylanicum]
MLLHYYKRHPDADAMYSPLHRRRHSAVRQSHTSSERLVRFSLQPNIKIADYMTTEKSELAFSHVGASTIREPTSSSSSDEHSADGDLAHKVEVLVNAALLKRCLRSSAL